LKSKDDLKKFLKIGNNKKYKKLETFTKKRENLKKFENFKKLG